MTDLLYLYIFVLAAFVGYEVISRVPVILHTPLMSGSNFVHGVVLVGAAVAGVMMSRGGKGGETPKPESPDVPVAAPTSRRCAGAGFLFLIRRKYSLNVSTIASFSRS